MDGPRFDDLARALAGTTTRRRLALHMMRADPKGVNREPSFSKLVSQSTPRHCHERGVSERLLFETRQSVASRSSGEKMGTLHHSLCGNDPRYFWHAPPRSAPTRPSAAATALGTDADADGPGTDARPDPAAAPSGPH